MLADRNLVVARRVPVVAALLPHRTSDSLQADAIAKLAQQTGTFTAAVAYLDDAYGRPLAGATVAALDDRASAS